METIKFGSILGSPGQGQTQSIAPDSTKELGELQPAPDPMTTQALSAANTAATVSSRHRSGTIGETTFTVTFTTAA